MLLAIVGFMFILAIFALIQSSRTKNRADEKRLKLIREKIELNERKQFQKKLEGELRDKKL